MNFYVYGYTNGYYYYYERTCGTEEAAKRRVQELGGRAVYLLNHLIRGAFY